MSLSKQALFRGEPIWMEEDYPGESDIPCLYCGKVSIDYDAHCEHMKEVHFSRPQ